MAKYVPKQQVNVEGNDGNELLRDGVNNEMEQDTTLPAKEVPLNEGSRNSNEDHEKRVANPEPPILEITNIQQPNGVMPNDTNVLDVDLNVTNDFHCHIDVEEIDANKVSQGALHSLVQNVAYCDTLYLVTCIIKIVDNKDYVFAE